MKSLWKLTFSLVVCEPTQYPQFFFLDLQSPKPYTEEICSLLN